MKDFIPVLVVFALIAIGGVFLVTSNTDGSSQQSSADRTTISNQESANLETKLIVGDPDAPATIVEYFDYKCPSCNQFHRTVAEEINQAYVDTGQANFEIRVTPIIGPDSATAARGAYCANDQGVFAEYHDTVLDYMDDNYYAERQFSAEFDNILTTDLLSGIVSEIGIDSVAFAACTESDRFNSNLDANLSAAADDSIQGTPGFAIGEQSFVGGQPFSVFKTLLDIELR